MEPASETASPTRPARRRRRRVLNAVGAVAAGLALLGGWFALAVDEAPLDVAYAGPAPVGSAVAARFAYVEEGTRAAEIAEWDVEDHQGYSRRWVKVLATLPGQPAHHVQIVHYRAHAPGPRPAVVMTPILGGSGEVAEAIAAHLAAEGIHVAIVWRAQSMLDSSQDATHLEFVLRVAVIDRRRAVDWLEGRDDVDPNRIGACGVSMGGIVTSALLAAEPRIQAGVLALAGGDLPALLEASDQPRVRRYVRERGERGVDLAALQADVRASVPSEPLALAAHVDARRVLFVAAARDTTVPYAQQEALHAALGKPARITLPTGHYTSLIYFPYLMQRIVAFFEEQLGGRTTK